MALSRILAASAAGALLASCGSVPPDPGHSTPNLPGARMPSARQPVIDPDLPVLPAAGSGRGGYYKDDGPGDNPPPNLRDVPDAVVRAEPYSRYANRPYTVFGKTYTPIVNEAPFVQRGIASWYGKKFHGQRTSSGEIYDMYKMSAAHPTLPIPSYARITSVATGKQVIVRINDRGPFHASRIVDVSYTAALKLGLLGKGSHEVVLERLLPNAAEHIATTRRNAPEPDLPEVSTSPVDVPPPIVALSDQPEAAPAAAPLSVPGFYVQLGAFGNAATAAAIRDRLAQAGGALGSIEVVVAGTLHRIFSGPFASREEALQALREVPEALRLKPIVIRR